MDRVGITNLLQKIAVNYPQFRKHIETPSGGIYDAVVSEWERQLGYLDLSEAVQRLDSYMMSEDGGRIPKAVDLKRYKTVRKDSEIFTGAIHHQYHLEFSSSDHQKMYGRLYDEENREYSHDPTYEGGYHYDRNGNICTKDGRVVTR